jgi:hypothetical protein
MLPMASASLFLNIVAPSAGMSGMAIFIAEARRMKYSTGRAAVAGAVVLLLDYAAFLFVLALGISRPVSPGYAGCRGDNSFCHHACHIAGRSDTDLPGHALS